MSWWKLSSLFFVNKVEFAGIVQRLSVIGRVMDFTLNADEVMI